MASTSALPGGSRGRSPSAPASPESVSSARQVVSGILSSSASGSSSSCEACSGAGEPAVAGLGPEQPGRRVQDRLVWQNPKPSRKSLWRRRKQERRRRELLAARPRQVRPVSPELFGTCFKCLQEGHVKRVCKNKMVCIRCGDEGHGSYGCKRPRSPGSEEELLRKALALVASRRAATQAGGASQPGAQGRCTPAALQPGVQGQGAPVAARTGQPPQLAGDPSGSRVARSIREREEVCSMVAPPSVLPCIIPRSAELNELERRLRHSLVAYVGGARPRVSREQVEDALICKAKIPKGAFSVHYFKPEDFLVVFSSDELRRQVSSKPSLPHENFTLFFRPWTRLAQAERRVARSRVVLALEGIPPHAWARSTVEHLLNTSCSVEALAPETANRTDLGTFRLSGWSPDAEAIPPERDLWVPEPEDFVLEEAVPRPTGRDRERGLLRYRVLIHLSRVEEFHVLEEPGFGPSSPGSGQSGLPDPGSFGGGEAGYWTTRNPGWTSGVPDQRGGYPANGAGSDVWRRRAGQQVAAGRQAPPTNWRLPPILGPVNTTVADRVGPGAAFPEPAAVTQRASGAEQTRRRSGSDLDLDGGQQRSLLSGRRVLASASQAASPVATSGTLLAANRQASLSLVGASQPVLDTEVGVAASLQKGVEAEDPEAAAHSLTRSRPGQEGTGSSVNGEDQYFQVSLSSEERPMAQNTPAQEASLIKEAQVVDQQIGAQGVTLPVPATIDAGSIPVLTVEASTQAAIINAGFNPVQAVEASTQAAELDLGPTGMSQKEEVAFSRIKSFCGKLLKMLAPPLLKEIESANALSASAEPFTPRRVTRSSGGLPPAPSPVCRGKVPRKASAADSSLLKALGIVPNELVVNEEHVAELQQLFDSPLRDQDLRAIAAIYGKTLPEEFAGGHPSGFPTGSQISPAISAC